jgi:hypothetical protein
MVGAVFKVVEVGGMVRADQASPLTDTHAVLVGVIVIFREVALDFTELAYIVLCTYVPCETIAWGIFLGLAS